MGTLGQNLIGLISRPGRGKWSDLAASFALFEPAGSDIESKIEELCKKNKKAQAIEIVSLIKEIIPEYRSNNSKFEVLDIKQTKNQIN